MTRVFAAAFATALCLGGEPAFAQRAELDPDETELTPTASLDEEEAELDDAALDADEVEIDAPGDTPGQEDGDSDSGTEAGPSKETVFDAVWKSKRVTLSHEAGVQASAPAGVIANRIGLRLEGWWTLTRWLLAGVDGKLFLFLPGDHRAAANGDALRAFFNLREAYLQASVGETSVKLGQQIVVWGESEAGAVTDIISPRDYTEFLFPTIADSRLGVPALSVDQYTGAGTFSLVVVPWPLGDRMPESGSAYDAGGIAPAIGVVDDAPRSLRDTELGFRWRHSIGKADLSLMAASVLDNQPTIVADGTVDDGSPVLRRRHRRYEMTGTSAALAVGNALWKIEAACEHDRALQTRSMAVLRRDIARLSFGVEATLVDRTLIVAEGGATHVIGWGEELLAPRPTDPFAAVIVMRTLLHETMTAQLLGIAMPLDETFILKLYESYAVTAALRVVFDGGALLLGEASNFAELRGKHRANLRLEYRF